jgi:aryl-alcohol dehydrogenase-like predicted oxidoreductase
MTRRELIRLAALAAGSACASRRSAGTAAPPTDAAAAAPDPAPTPSPAPAPPETSTMNTRPIPRTGELLPIIGLGTWQTFDVGADPADRAPLAEVLARFLAAGGRLIDSSPMYGNAETVVGDLRAERGGADPVFLATKVWTSGKREGIAEMKRSMQRMRTEKMDLMQVHNLLDWKTHLPVLRDWKAAGTIRYLGVTHYARSAFDDLEQLIKTEHLDFVQLPYNIANRDAEARLLPAAADTGTAVIVMRPFAEGALFSRVKGKQLPAWAADFDCASWGQFFLKFILGHPAVTCPIPATSKPHHLDDNVGAGRGRLPDAATRATMIAHLGL